MPEALSSSAITTTTAVPARGSVVADVSDPSTVINSGASSRWRVDVGSLNGCGLQFAIGDATDASGKKATITIVACQVFGQQPNNDIQHRQDAVCKRLFVAKYEVASSGIGVPSEHLTRMVSSADIAAFPSWHWADTWTAVGTTYLCPTGLQEFGSFEKALDCWSHNIIEVYGSTLDGAGDTSAGALAGLWRPIQL